MNFPPVRVVAAAWAVISAALYVINPVGVPVGAGAAPAGRTVGGFAAYDIAVVIGCLVAAAVALWGRRWMLILVGFVPLAGGLVGLGLAVQQAIGGRSVLQPTLWVVPWLVLGGVLFMIAARRPTTPEPSGTRPPRDHDVPVDR